MGSMVYRRWRSALEHWGDGELGWRWECQFYGLLGRFYLMSSEIEPKPRALGWGSIR